MQWWLIFARGLALPTAFAVVGILASNVLGKLGAAFPAGNSIETAAPWLMDAGFAGALVLTLTFSWPLVPWEKGSGGDCRHCYGPLGRLRMGRVMYGKQLPDFRRCYNCGQATPEATSTFQFLDEPGRSRVSVG